MSLNLRSDNTVRETKLAVLDCSSMILKGYEGRHHCQTVKVEPDNETTSDFMKEVVEEIRVTSDAEQEREERIINERHAYAEAEIASWIPAQ